MLRIDTSYAIALRELACGAERLTDFDGPVLAVRSSHVINCSLEWITGAPEPQVANDTASALHAERLVSQLPAGFGALDIQGPCLNIHCSTALEQPIKRAAAALELCLFFAHAPASYRWFSVSWRDDRPLRVDLQWPVGFAGPGSMMLDAQGRVAFEGPKALARHLRRCARTMNMSFHVAFEAAPPRRVLVFRL